MKNNSLHKIFLLFLIVPILLGGCKPTQAEVDNNYNNGVTYLEKNQYSSALQEFKTSINNNSSNTDSYIKAAEILGKKKQYDEAIAILENGRDVVAEPDLVYQALGEVFMLKKDYPNAELNFRESVNKDKTNWKAIEGFATALLLQGKYDDASQVLENPAVNDNEGKERLKYLKALLIADDFDKSLDLFSQLDQSKAQYKTVYDALKKAKETDGNKIEDLMSLSYAIINNGDYAYSVELLELVIKENEYYHGGQMYLGYVYLKLEDYTRAKDYLTKALELDSSDPTTLQFIALAYTKLNQEKDALDTYGSLVALESQNEQVRIDFINALISFKNFEKAVEQAKALADIKGSIENRLIYTKRLLEVQDYKTAIDQLNKAFESEEYKNSNDEVKSRVLTYKGWVTYKLGDKATGKEMVDESIRLSNSSADAYYYLGTIYLEMQDYQNAKTNLERAIDLDLEGNVSYLAAIELKQVK